MDFINIRHGNDDSIHTPEPFLGTAKVRESGFNWERATYGGRTLSINLERSGRYGVAIMDWPIQKQHLRQISYHAIRMDYIERIQQQKHWDSIAKLAVDEDKSRYLYVPRHDCAMAWGEAFVMPMRFADLEQERLWNLADKREAEEDRLEELEYAENDKIPDELDRKEEERKAKVEGSGLGQGSRRTARMGAGEVPEAAGTLRGNRKSALPGTLRGRWPVHIRKHAEAAAVEEAVNAASGTEACP